MPHAQRFLESVWARIIAWTLLVLSLILSVAVQFVVRDQSQCVKDWADVSTARTERIEVGSGRRFVTRIRTRSLASPGMSLIRHSMMCG